MASLPKPAGISAEEARQLIVKAFADRPDVMAITLVIGPTHWRIRVITNHQKYEYDVMTELLTREIDLREQLEDISIEVDYVPQLMQPIEDVVPHNAFLVFRR
jgi:hypothetical protein